MKQQIHSYRNTSVTQAIRSSLNQFAVHNSFGIRIRLGYIFGSCAVFVLPQVSSSSSLGSR